MSCHLSPWHVLRQVVVPQRNKDLQFSALGQRSPPGIHGQLHAAVGRCRTDDHMYQPVPPVAYQVILGPGIGQFREFESPRVHTRINSWGLFLVHKLTCGKRESVS